MSDPTNRSEVEDAALPLGWATVRVDQAGAVRLGRQRSPDHHSGANLTKYVRAANITPLSLDLADLMEMNFTPAEQEVFGLHAGNVLLTEASGSSSQVGRAAIWRGEVEPCCYQNTVIRFRPHLTTPGYALIVFRYFAVAGVFARSARGSASSISAHRASRGSASRFRRWPSRRASRRPRTAATLSFGRRKPACARR